MRGSKRSPSDAGISSAAGEEEAAAEGLPADMLEDLGPEENDVGVEGMADELAEGQHVVEGE